MRKGYSKKSVKPDNTFVVVCPFEHVNVISFSSFGIESTHSWILITCWLLSESIKSSTSFGDAWSNGYTLSESYMLSITDANAVVISLLLFDS